MEIEDFLSYFPTDNLQKNIFEMKEFNELTLKPYESKPTIVQYDDEEPKLYFKYQVLIQRFFSDKTPNMNGLIFHGLGSGKTRTSALATEINSSNKKPLILLPRDNLEKNYRRELLKISSTYTPKNAKGHVVPPTTYNYDTYLKKATKSTYEMHTFGKFINKLKKMSDQEIINKYSNRIIVIDEVHNLRTDKKLEDLEKLAKSENQEKKEKLKIDKKKEKARTYLSIYKFLKLIKNSKILLLSGTPIWDNVNELASIMNLITNDFPFPKFDSNNKLTNGNELTNAMKGLVSYVREEQSNIKKNVQGTVISPMKHGKAYASRLSSIQEKGIKKAIEKESSEFRLDEQYASNFTFEYEGEIYSGREFFNKFIKQDTKHHYKFINDKIARLIKKNLDKYSPKYKAIIDIILSRPSELHFVYDKSVEGTGLILFGLLLELFNFQYGNDEKEFNKPAKRYVLITGKETKVQRLLNAYNDPKNKNGDYINVILGSKTISEGITLKNTKTVHLFPYWNLSGMDQAIARIIRYGAHEDLVGANNSFVDVYIHVAVDKNNRGVDMDIYSAAEEKDLKTRQIIRLFKKAAFDCPINYKRNVLSVDVNGSRECDYQQCNYDCTDVTHSGITNSVYDYVPEKTSCRNFNLFYNSEAIQKIKLEIEIIFKKQRIYKLSEITSLINYNKQLIMTTLSYLVEFNIPLFDANGLLSYLFNKDDNYFIVSFSAEKKTSMLNPFFTRNTIINVDTSLSKLIKTSKIEKTSKKDIKNVCDSTPNNIYDAFTDMSSHMKILLLETAYEIYNSDIDSDNKEKSKALLFNKNVKDKYFFTLSLKNIWDSIIDYIRITFPKGTDHTNIMKKFVFLFFPEQVEDFTKEITDKIIAFRTKKSREEKKRTKIPKEDKLLKNLLANLNFNFLKIKSGDFVAVHIVKDRELRTNYKVSLRSDKDKTRFYNKFTNLWEDLPDELNKYINTSIEKIQQLNLARSLINNPFEIFATKSKRGIKIHKTYNDKVSYGKECTSESVDTLEKYIESIVKIYQKRMKILRNEGLLIFLKKTYNNTINNPYGYYEKNNTVYNALNKEVNKDKYEKITNEILIKPVIPDYIIDGSYKSEQLQNKKSYLCSLLEIILTNHSLMFDSIE